MGDTSLEAGSALTWIVRPLKWRLGSRWISHRKQRHLADGMNMIRIRTHMAWPSRFSLRFLFLALLLCAALLGWLASLKAQGEAHARVAEELASLGSIVRFTQDDAVAISGTRNSIVEIGGVVQIQNTVGPTFINRIRGSVLSRRIASVKVQNKPNLASILELLGQLQQIDSLAFTNTGITDSQITTVLSKTRVRALDLSREKFAWTSDMNFAGKGMIWLCVARTQFNDASIGFVPATLEHLDATHTRVTDAGLPAFIRLKSLKTLNLSRTRTSRAKVELLRDHMPWCAIEWQP